MSDLSFCRWKVTALLEFLLSLTRLECWHQAWGCSSLELLKNSVAYCVEVRALFSWWHKAKSHLSNATLTYSLVDPPVGHLLQGKLLLQSAKASSIYKEEQHLITFAYSTNYQQATVTVQLKPRGLYGERNTGKGSPDNHIASGAVHHRQTVLWGWGQRETFDSAGRMGNRLTDGKATAEQIGERTGSL